MFEFEAGLLKQGYTIWGKRISQNIHFLQPVIDKIEGRLIKHGVPYHHSHGDLPISVVTGSLDGTITIIPSEATSDINILSIGKAIPGMKDGPPNDPKARSIPEGSDVYILTGVKMLTAKEFVATTSYAILWGKYNDLKLGELSLEDWSKLYKTKTKLDWELSEKELKKQTKSKNSCFKNSKIGYNSVSEEDMECILGGTYEDLAEKLREDGMEEVEISKLIAELEMAVEAA